MPQCERFDGPVRGCGNAVRQVAESLGELGVPRPFARVMHVDLSGSDKRMVIQPVAYDGPGVWVEDQAPSSQGQAGRLALVK